MQTQYKLHEDPAVEGQPVGDRKSRPMALPWLPQITEIVIADGSPAASEPWTIDFANEKTGQVFTLAFTSGASLAATLDNLVAAVAANAKIRDLFTVTEDGVDTAEFTARHANVPYTVTVTPGGSATATPTDTQDAGGAGVEFGRLVKRGADDETYEAVAAGTTLAQVVGVLFRTDGNHFHPLENDGPAVVDTSRRGDTMAIMYEGRFMAKVEDAVTPTSTAYLRIAGTGRIGALRATADGGNTINVSSICKFETSAAAGGLARVFIRV